MAEVEEAWWSTRFGRRAASAVGKFNERLGGGRAPMDGRLKARRLAGKEKRDEVRQKSTVENAL